MVDVWQDELPHLHPHPSDRERSQQMRSDRARKSLDQLIRLGRDKTSHHVANSRVIHRLRDLVLQFIKTRHRPESDGNTETLRRSALPLGYTDPRPELNSFEMDGVQNERSMPVGSQPTRNRTSRIVFPPKRCLSLRRISVFEMVSNW